MRKYEVVTLCGSSRFKEDFIKVQEELTLKGAIVISLGIFSNLDKKYDLKNEQIEMLAEMHKQKMDVCDTVFVINKGGYIGRPVSRR